MQFGHWTHVCPTGPNNVASTSPTTSRKKHRGLSTSRWSALLKRSPNCRLFAKNCATTVHMASRTADSAMSATTAHNTKNCTCQTPSPMTDSQHLSENGPRRIVPTKVPQTAEPTTTNNPNYSNVLGIQQHEQHMKNASWHLSKRIKNPGNERHKHLEDARTRGGAPHVQQLLCSVATGGRVVNKLHPTHPRAIELLLHRQ